MFVVTPIQTPLAAITFDMPTVRPFLTIKFELVAKIIYLFVPVSLITF